MSFDPNLTKPHFNVSIYRGILAYIEKTYPTIDTEKLCAEMGLPKSYFLKPTNWVSIEFASYFTRRCIEVTNNPQISYLSGMASVSPSTVGEGLFHYFWKSISTRAVYQMLPHLTGLLSKITRVVPINIGLSSAIFELSIRDEILATEDEREAAAGHYMEIYESTLGYYAAIPTVHQMPCAVAAGQLVDRGRRFPDYRIELKFTDIGFRVPFQSAVLISLFAMIGFLANTQNALFFSTLGGFLGLSISLAIRLRATMSALGRGSEAMTHQAEQYAYIQKKRAASDRFVPWEFVHLLGKEELEDLQLGDAIEKEITVLFCDINEFTPISEKLGSQMTSAFLNRFFAMACPILRKHHGRDVPFQFDEVVAVFPTSSVDAVNAAGEMLCQLETFNAEMIAKGLPAISIKIGINTGRMSIGVQGYEESMRISFTASEGAAGKRIQQMGKDLGAAILVGESTIEKARNSLKLPSRFVGKLFLKGLKGRHSVFEICPGINPSEVMTFLSTKSQFEAGVAELEKGNLLEAIASFEQVLQRNPKDQVAANLLKRARDSTSAKISKALPNY